MDPWWALLLQTTLFTATASPKWTQERLQRADPRFYFKTSNYACTRRGLKIHLSYQCKSETVSGTEEGGFRCQSVIDAERC